MGDTRDIYNRHRPTKFEDMYKTSTFLDNIVSRISKALAGQPGLQHSYMFYSESPGLGKTTSGRILASELNPDMSSEERENLFKGLSNPVCIHINGGEKRKIDDMRVVIERVESLRIPMYDYKYVFLVDEVHKLTDDSVDALLAPVENCPENVYWIFTTTDISKMKKPHSPQEALLSRCESHKFKPLNKAETSRLLLDICKAEGQTAPYENVIEQLYVESAGRPRRAILLLSQYLETGKVGTIEEEEKDETPYFKELINLYAGTIGGKGNSWQKDFVPLIHRMLNEYAAEDARIRLMMRLFYVIMGSKGVKLAIAKFFAEMADVLSTPISAPQKSDLGVRLYRLYIQAIELGKLKP